MQLSVSFGLMFDERIEVKLINTNIKFLNYGNFNLDHFWSYRRSNR